MLSISYEFNRKTILIALSGFSLKMAMTGEQKLKNLEVEPKVEYDSKSNTKSPSTLRHWSTFNNPRIVRVSRASGGKDRHSKVTTIRGLRDRRIRLSVPTAMQLYDLQDRLGLSQPSKVIDWLLDVTKDEIDQLPPLMVPMNYSHFYSPTLNLDPNYPKFLATSLSPFYNENLSLLKDGASQSLLTSKDAIRENSNFGNTVGKSKAWSLDSSEQNQDASNYNSQISAQNFFPVSSQSSFPNLLNNSIPYSSFYHSEPDSNLCFSQFENNGFQNHVDGGHSSQLQSIQPSGSHSYLYSTTPTPPNFHPNSSYVCASLENETRHVNMFSPNPFISSLHLNLQGDENEPT